MFSDMHAVPAAQGFQWIGAITQESDWSIDANLEHAAWSVQVTCQATCSRFSSKLQSDSCMKSPTLWSVSTAGTA